MACRYSHLPAKNGKLGFILDNSTGKRYPGTKYEVIHKPDHRACRLQRIPK